MLETSRYHIKYPAGTDLVKDASGQFRQMAESIDDNIDTLPAKITDTVVNANEQAQQAAERAKEYAAQAGTLTDGAVNAILSDRSKKSFAAVNDILVPSRRTVVVAGDSVSYGTGTSAPATKSWPAQLAALTGWTVYNYAEENAAFKQAGTGMNRANFVGQLKACADSLGSSSIGVTDVIIAGGINDKLNTGGVEQAVVACLDYAHAAYPTARIHLVPVLLGQYGVGRYNNGNGVADLISQICSALRGQWVNLIRYGWEWNNGRPDLAHDEIHPNDAGAENLAKCIRSGMDGDSPRPVYHSAGTPGPGIAANQAAIICSSGMVSIDINIKLNASKPAYQALFTVPAWATTSRNGVMMCGRQDNQQPPFIYLDSGSGQIASTGAISAGQQLYISKSFPLGS